MQDMPCFHNALAHAPTTFSILGKPDRYRNVILL